MCFFNARIHYHSAAVQTPDVVLVASIGLGDFMCSLTIGLDLQQSFVRSADMFSLALCGVLIRDVCATTD